MALLNMCWASFLLIYFLLRSTNFSKGAVSFPVISIVKLTKIRYFWKIRHMSKRQWKRSVETFVKLYPRRYCKTLAEFQILVVVINLVRNDFNRVF